MLRHTNILQLWYCSTSLHFIQKLIDDLKKSFTLSIKNPRFCPKNLNLLQIHIFEISIFTKFTFWNLNFHKIHVLKISIFGKIHISEISIFTKFTFWNLSLHKIHNLKISCFPKFTFIEPFFQQNSHFSNHHIPDNFWIKSVFCPIVTLMLAL